MTDPKHAPFPPTAPPHHTLALAEPCQPRPWVLDRPQITTKEEWRKWMREVSDAPARPERLTRRQRAALKPDARQAYDAARIEYHDRFGPVRHIDFQEIYDEVLELAEDNWLSRSPTAWSSVLIDGEVSLGKTTLALHIAHRYELAMRAHYDLTDDGSADDFVPVVVCTLDEDLTVKGLDRALATFYAPPPTGKRVAEDYRHLVLECARRCGTTLFVVDDLHHLLDRLKHQAAVGGHLKRLMNELPATFLYAGVECTVLLNEGYAPHELHRAQNASRAHVYSLSLYPLATTEDRRAWASLIATFASHLVLADQPTDLWNKHATYLHQRTSGQMNALQGLLRRAANRAIRDGSERIDRRLLDSIKLANTAETRARAAGFRPAGGTRNPRVDRRSQRPVAR